MRKIILPVILLLSIMLGSCATSIGNVPLSSFTIYYENVNGGRLKNAGNELNKQITTSFGKKANIYSTAIAYDKLSTNGYEIHIGNTGLEETEAIKDAFVTPMDYTIKAVGTKIIIVGGTSYATAAATEQFINLLQENPSCYRKGLDYEYRFNTSWLNPICFDESLFTPLWSKSYTAPDWTDDYYESIYAVTQWDGRHTAFSHRGDFVYYPMCSLEGLYSGILAGADLMEIDFRLTKDNIPVVMHDEDLRVATDCASKMGKNGLPNSYYIGDWTYEQLRKLNMVKQDKTITTCKIATCYEVLLVAKNHGALLSWDDKADDTKHKVFAATTSTSIDDMLPLMLETDTLDNFLYYYWYLKDQAKDSFWRGIPGTSEKFKKNYEFWSKCVARAKAERGNVAGIWAFWNDPGRYSAWSYSSHNETEEYWKMWYDEGKTQQWTNNIIDFCKYMTANFGPEDYSALL